MSRTLICIPLLTVLLSAFLSSPVRADSGLIAQAGGAAVPPTHIGPDGLPCPVPPYPLPGGWHGPAGGPYGVYPQIQSPMYPVPQPGVPLEVGGAAVITNPALAPQEMLYHHKYRALYPPFYYKTHGVWVVTPFGVRSHERVRLQGTEVTVRYKSYYGLFSGFVPPASR